MSEYTDSVERHLKGLRGVSTGVCPGCETCRDTYAPDATMEEFDELWSSGEVFDEGGFSASGCQICGSYLGGDRYCWHWIDEENEIWHEDNACVDCVMFLANGAEPDHWER